MEKQDVKKVLTVAGRSEEENAALVNVLLGRGWVLLDVLVKSSGYPGEISQDACYVLGHGDGGIDVVAEERVASEVAETERSRALRESCGESGIKIVDGEPL